MRKITRKIITVAVMCALLTLLTAGLALAATIRCETDADENMQCFGTRVADDIRGTNENDVIFADDGNDTVEGRDGDDAIAGEEGDDAIADGNGNNTTDGGLGNDVLAGGDGIDRISDAAQRDKDQVGSAGGNDVVNVRDDDGRDVVNYGAGRDDTVRADRGDNIAKNCENVRIAKR